MLRLSANSSPTSDRRAGCPPNIFQLPKVLTEAEVIEAEAELKALQRHALEVVDPKAETQPLTNVHCYSNRTNAGCGRIIR